MLAVACSACLSQSAFAGYSDAALRNKPVGYWRLGEANISDPLKDISGNANDGVYDDFGKDPPGLEVGLPGAIVGDTDTAVKIGNARGFGEGDNGQGVITPGGSLDIGVVGDIKGTAEAWFQITPTEDLNATWSYPRIFHYNNFELGQFSFRLVWLATIAVAPSFLRGL